MAEPEIELTILMPCLNEAETLGRCIEKARAFLERSGVRGEVLVADNGSTDGSQEIARHLGARVVDVPLRGYGAALYEGSVSARGRFIIMGDSDDSYDFSSLQPFVDRLREGFELAMGNRFLGGILPGAMPWKNRFIGNPALSGLGRLLFNSPVRDFHCGLRGYTKAAFVKMGLRTTGMEFASEMVIKAVLLGMRTTEVPIRLHRDGRSRPPHLQPWRDGWRHLRFMFLYSPRWLFLYPGLLAMASGTAVGVWLFPHPRFIGAVGLDVHTMLFAAMAVLVGFQGVSFFAFSRIFAVLEGLVPESPTLNRMFRFLTLESGLVVGGLLLFGGLAGSVLTLEAWARVGFGHLDTSHTLRAAIPAVLAITLGFEVLFASFFLSMIGLRLRRRDDANGS
jgi:glycosyltransferase involved in cell wall biosynthesis